MLKKSTLILFVFFVSCITQTINATISVEEEFNPESVHFSKMETLKTWVADKHHEDLEFMSALQQVVSFILPQRIEFEQELGQYENNPQYLFGMVVGDDGKESFGRPFFTVADIELQFLQQIKKISQNKKVVTLEIAAANGLVSCKAPLAFENGGYSVVYA